jgi:hypothetical protein
MSGGKGGSTTSEIKIPEWLEAAARQNIGRADEIAQIGYVPYYGPDVAAMTPMQMSAGNNINAAADAFGLGSPTSINAGMPNAMDYGGMSAYSSAPMYQQSLDELQMRAPGQYNALQAPFIDPITGARPAAPFGTGQAYSDPMQNQMPTTTPVMQQSSGRDDGGFGAPTFAPSNRSDRMQGPISPSGAVAESGFRSDLTRSLSDPFYDPPGNVVTRALGVSGPKARAGDSMGGGK